jgi:tetratricopeptide (TPR) repeat protein
MAGKIFINYRRGDDPGYTGRLFDWLQDVFDRQQLFMDVDNIAPGLDFVRELDERVGECDVMLAVIGKNWIDARDATGARRLDDPNDFVRIEIASALSQGKRVIPVLVGEAQMPRLDELPDTLKPLARRNAVRLTHERFSADIQGLVKALQQTLGQTQTPPAWPIRVPSEAKEQSSASAASQVRAGMTPGMIATLTASAMGVVVVLAGAIVYLVAIKRPIPETERSQIVSQASPSPSHDPSAETLAALPTPQPAAAPGQPSQQVIQPTAASAPTQESRLTESSGPLRLELVTQCDRLAGDPEDRQSPPGAGGIFNLHNIDVVQALKACNEAVRQYPNVARFAYQAGRIAIAQEDFKFARQMFEKAIGMGSTIAVNALGTTYLFAPDPDKDYTRALQLFQRSAAEDEPSAMTSIGLVYLNGYGVPKDSTQARQWFEKAAAAGNVFAMVNLGLLYEYGSGVPKDYAQAAQWFEKAVAAGDSRAMVNLGSLYEKDDIKDYAQARQWYEKAVATGETSALTRTYLKIADRARSAINVG